VPIFELALLEVGGLVTYKPTVSQAYPLNNVLYARGLAQNYTVDPST